MTYDINHCVMTVCKLLCLSIPSLHSLMSFHVTYKIACPLSSFLASLLHFNAYFLLHPSLIHNPNSNSGLAELHYWS